MSVDSDRKCERRWPPGFRFHPTDEELVLYYLKRKILGKRLLNPNIIPVLDVYKSDPEDLPHKSPTGERQWFFFTPRDRYSPASRAHRAATGFGYWKATGKDRTITCNSRSVGLKKTLVFYRGRAPKGLRTDWVMHEYTLTQGELNRSSCHNNNSPPKDYYALYKVYKKSGPGPKNGEQYGAPFREEEWADDEEPIDVHIPPSLPITHHRYPDNIEVRFDNAALMQSPSLTDVAAQNMANSNIPPNPIPDQQHQQIISGSTPQVAGEGETHSPAANSFPQCQGNRIAPTPTNQQSPDFHHVPLSTQGLQLPGAPEVVSAPTDGAEEFFLPGEDFLEVDDLIGTEPTPSSFKDPAGSVAFEDFDGLGDLDVYHDTVMFLNDIGQVDQGAISHPYMNDSLEGNMNGELSYQLPPESGDVNQIGAQLQEHDQIYDTFSSMGTNYETFLDSTSGVADKPMDLLRNENQDPGHEDDNVGFTSEFSSALWAFVDSIPSSPASAAEHALVNRAFERLSSFGRLRVNAVNVNSVGCYDGATVKRTGRRKELFFCSVIGAFCAISWVVVGSFSIFE